MTIFICIICIISVLLWIFCGFAAVMHANSSRKMNWFGFIFLFSFPFMAFIGSFLADNIH